MSGLIGSAEGGASVDTARGGAEDDASGGAGTLAAIYAAGLAADPTADNLFAMPDGNRRWADETSVGSSLGTVSDAFWETALSTADRRVGAWLARRAVGAGNPSATYVTDVLYDPAYAGTLLDGRQWVLDDLYMTGDLAETGVTGDAYAQHRVQAVNFFDNQPLSIPSQGSAAGATVNEITDLWNGGSGGRLAPSRILTAWGQENIFAQPQHAGITPAVMAWYDPATTADAIGNGTGFFCGWGTGTNFPADRFTGGLSVTMEALDVNGAYQVGLWARADHTTINQVATFNNAGGTINGQPIVTLPPGVLPGINFLSEPIDFTVTGVYPMAPPNAARVLQVSGAIEAKTVGGTRSGVPTFSIGTNAPNYDNLYASSPGQSQFLTSAAEDLWFFFAGYTGKCPDMTTSGLKINVTVPLTGAGAVFTGRLSIQSTTGAP